MAQTGIYGGRCIEGHTAVIFDRGGTRRVGQLMDLSSVVWERLRDATSEARVRVTGRACSMQKAFISSLSTHRHEMAIYRGKDRVWEGPLHRITWYSDSVEVVAHDITEYLLHQPLTQTWSNAFPSEPSPVSTRIGGIIEYEMTHGRTQIENGLPIDVPAWEDLDPPANVVAHVEVHNYVNEAETAMVTYPYTMTVGEHLESLSRYQGIDYTAVGRALHIWDVSRALGRTAQLTEKNFVEEPIITEYGADHSQAAYVVGTPPPDSKVPIYGSAIRSENLDYYGPWTTVFTPYNEEGTDSPTQPELNSQALRNLAGRTPAPIEVRIPDNSTVVLGDEISIRDLVPGVQVPLRAALGARTVSQMQKIDRMQVSETPDDGEKISITLSPTSRPDADEELPEQENRVTAFFGDTNYQLRVAATRQGTSYIIKATVYQLGPGGLEEVGAGSWSAVAERLEGTNVTPSGSWSYQFQHYDVKTVFVTQVDNAAPGFRDFSVTVTMGGGIGSATASGTVEI